MLAVATPGFVACTSVTNGAGSSDGCTPPSACDGGGDVVPGDGGLEGADGASCGSATTNITPLASGNVSGLAADATDLYWYTSPSAGGTAVMRLPASGGAPVAVTSFTASAGTNLAIGGQQIYWGTSQQNGSSMSLLSMPATGGGVTTLLSGSSFHGQALAVDATGVYWSDEGCFCQSAEGTIFSLPIAGGSPKTLVGGQGAPSLVSIDASNVYWENGGVAVTVSTSPVQYERSGNALLALPLSGGSAKPTTLYGETPFVEGTGGLLLGAAALDPNGSFVYVVEDPERCYTTCQAGDSFSSSIRRVPIAGGATVTIVSSQNWISSIAVDSNDIYWTNGGTMLPGDNPDGTVMKVPLSGGAATMIASGQDNPTDIVVDANSIYWVNLNTLASEGPNPSKTGATIMKATPKCAF